ncbi:FAD-dependent oxidoreductase [Daejeonella sp.]|uniref:NAD(P)/FAD-dependent oxidoreductase n=1 Tax=Daejeonella sp. TaxID=2805397 RepID=UPI003784D052
MTKNKTDVLIIGAGLAGLSAARVLKSAGRDFKILEASDAPGGRVRTDHLNGFLLDRGFQVLLTAYPEAKHFLDYKALDLQAFSPGSIILNDSGIDQIGDPLREISSLITTLKSPVGSFFDKIKLLKLKLKLAGSSIDDIFLKPEISTLNHLKNSGFSDRIISNFFIPFLSGIFLENKLETSSRMFEFVFKMFSEADTAIPAKGMGMIPMQLASKLSPEELILNESVLSIEGNEVLTVSGNKYQADTILLATRHDSFPMPFKSLNKGQKSVTCLYFSADQAPYQQKLIALNANPTKLLNNVAVMSNVSKNYAPEGKSLISISIIEDCDAFNAAELELKVKDELKFWYPECVDWKHLKTYKIPYALPENKHVLNDINPLSIRLDDSTFICGDHLLNGSINAAMKSGRLAAESILSL